MMDSSAMEWISFFNIWGLGLMQQLFMLIAAAGLMRLGAQPGLGSLRMSAVALVLITVLSFIMTAFYTLVPKLTESNTIDYDSVAWIYAGTGLTDSCGSLLLWVLFVAGIFRAKP